MRVSNLESILGQKQDRCGIDEFYEVAFFLKKKAVISSGLAKSILFLPYVSGGSY